MDLALIQELYRYNRWANDRVFEAVAALSPQDFTKGLGNSYPSVRDTLRATRASAMLRGVPCF
jgi:uncharacterized damage-inducible protein DinB